MSSPKNLSSPIRRYWDFTQQPDVILVVEDEDIYAHRAVLSYASPVFRVMLESDHFIEKNSTKINLPYKKVEDIQQLLNFIYPFGHQITGLEKILLCVSVKLSKFCGREMKN